MDADEAATRPAPRRTSRWLIAGALVLIVALLIGGAVVWGNSRKARPQTATPAAVAPSAEAASAQAKAVADLLQAYAVNDRARIAELLTVENLPWTAPAPPIPAGVPTFIIEGMVKPQQRGNSWVLGDKSFALVTLTGNGRNPIGEVAADIQTPGGSRSATATVVLRDGQWKVKAINGQLVSEAVGGFLR